jgi:outer membrane receptor protein involved in Fe transport
MNKLLRLVALAAMLGCLVLPGSAQTSSATITGHVVDQSNAVVPYAEVKLVNQATSVEISTHTNASGNFVFPDVQPGTFNAIVQAPGFKAFQKVGLMLSASQNLSAGTFILQVGEVSQSVTVTADITALQTSSAERSDVIDTKQTENLLAIGRDAMALVRLMPGVVGSEGGSSLGTSSTPTINGINSEYNSTTIDGVTGNTRGLSTLDTPLNLDAIQEITVLSANYQAQYGKTAGANMNIVTKGGTQQFRGSLYEYFRNEDLNANSYMNKYNSQARPRYRYNTFGGTIGGPVYWPGIFNNSKNKLFFFVSLEDSPITSPDGLKYYEAPTALEVSGDFSQTYAQGNVNSVLQNIKMPGQTTSSCAATGTPGKGCYPGNVIPASQINPAEQALLNVAYANTLGLHPTWGFTNRAISAGKYNYITNYSTDKPVYQEIFRVDYAPTEKLHMFGRGDLETVNDNSYSSPANDLPWLMKVNYKTSNPNFAYNVMYMITPTLVNELNMGTAGWSEAQLYQKDDLAKVQLSTSGYNIPSLYAGVNPLNLFPNVSFGGVTNPTTFGWDSRFPMKDQVRSYSATDNLTKIIGHHTLKFGVDAQTDSYSQPSNNRVGSFAYGTDSKNILDSGYAYANALLGNFDTMTQATKLTTYKPRTNTFEWYTQDQWKANDHLTLDYGVRYSWAMAQRLSTGNNFNPSLYSAANAPVLYASTATKDKNGIYEALDPTTGNYVPGAYAGLFVPGTGNLQNGILNVNTPGYPQGTVDGNGVLFAPRVGFAYDPLGKGKTVIRGGYGIFYNVRARSGQEGDLANNAPTVNSPEQFYGNVSTFQNAGGLNGPFGIGHAIPLHAPEVSTMNISLGVQQQTVAGIVVDAAYVGTLGRHLTDYTPINEVPYGAEFQWSSHNPQGGILSDNFFRPYPGFGSINMQNFNLTSNYNALQMKVTRRFSRGLEFGGAYTWSKAMDYADSYNQTVAMYQNLRAWNYGPSSSNRKHNLVVNYLWSIPKVSRIWSNFATRAALDNWQVSGIGSYISGAPGQIGYSTTASANITGGGDGARVVLSCDPMHGAPHTFAQWFNTGCVSLPGAGIAATSATSGYTLGQTGNSHYENYVLPGYTNFDTALFKNVPIKGRFGAQFRLETYNTFNHAEWTGVNATAKYAAAVPVGQPAPAQTDATFGQKNATASPRYVQLALRINF